MGGIGLKCLCRMSYVCWVCGQDTLPAPNNRDVGDPTDLDSYKSCVVCSAFVPSRIRRTKAYQRRWDEQNASDLFREVMNLREQIQKLSPQDLEKIL